MARDPKAEIEISAHSRGLQAKLREARVKFSRFGAELKKEVFGKELVEKGFWGKAGAHMVGGLGARAVGGAVEATGGFLFDSAKSAMHFQDQLVRLQITSNKTSAEMQAFGENVRNTARDTGISADKILAAAQAYVALTGDMDGAAAASDQWARIAQATNSNIDDISKTAAALKQNLAIRPDEMTAAFSALAVQGKEGAIELKDLAAQLSSIAPQWAEFGKGRGVQGLKELGAALQVVKRGFGGDAGETVTGLQSLLNAFQKNEKHFRAKGVHIYEKDGKTLRNVLDIVKDIGDSKLFRNATQLEKAFGRVEAYRAYLQLRQNRDVLDDLIEKAGDANAIGRDFNTYMSSPAGKMASASERLNQAIQEAFTPERIEKFADAMTSAVDHFTGAMEQVSSIWDHLTGREKITANPYDVSEEDAGVDNPGGLSDEATYGPLTYKTAKEKKAGRIENMRQWRKVYGVDNQAQIDKYDAAMADITSLPTKSSRIRKAVEQTMGGNGLPAAEAGSRYLVRERVPQKEIERVRQQFLAEQQKATGEKFLPALMNDLSRLPGAIDKLTAALAKQEDRPITVKADGNKIVDVQRNASQHARRPGG